MTLHDLLRELDARDVAIGLREDRLFIGARPETLGAKLMDQLRAHKAALESHFRMRAGQAEAIPALPRDREDWPLSFGQRQLWLIDGLGGGRSLEYHMPVALTLTGELDDARLEAALREVVRRHEVLRTVYAEVDGEPVQRVRGDESFALEREDVPVDAGDVDNGERATAVGKTAQRDAPTHGASTHEAAVREAAVREAAIRSAVARVVDEPFALSSALPIRARLLRLSPREHVLVVVLHHIASDGWSTGVLVRDFLAAYDALGRDEAPAWPVLPIQYTDYAAWQHGATQQARLQDQLTYWTRQLAQLPEIHGLALDRPRPARRRHHGAALRTTLDSGLTGALEALCRARGATLFMGLHAVFSALLARFSGESDIVVGTPSANRERPELADLIGFFVNTLVLRVRVDGEQDFEALLAQSRRTVLEAQAHQALPFERLVQALRPARSLSHSPLFQILLAMQEDDQAPAQLDGVQVDALEVPVESAQFDLALEASRGADGALELLWRYDTDLFDEASIQGFAQGLRWLAAAAVQTPDRAIQSLALVSPQERQALLALGQARVAPTPVQGSLAQRFLAQAARTPEAVALVDGQRQWRYDELAKASAALANRLHASGVRRGDRVGVFMSRSAHVVVALLAVLRRGAAYVPLDAMYPDERVAGILEDAQVRTVVADAVTAPRLGERDHVRADVDLDIDINLDTRTDANANANAKGGARANGDGEANSDVGTTAGADGDWASDEVDAGPEDLAYLIYTSGSTGQPKGVMVTHANVLRLFERTDSVFRFGAGDVWALFHSFAFDFSVWEMWGALLHGARLVVVDHEAARSTPLFHALVAEHGVTVLNQTPSAFQAFMEEDRRSPRALALRLVIFGGEALDLRRLVPWFERHGERARLVNMYGITETTVHVTHRDVTPGDALGESGSVIGRAIEDLSLWVLDAASEPVPRGVVGELCVGGPGVARGYWRRPELSAQRFVAHPALPESQRLYRSGDLARLRHDGELEYLGRGDHQLKIRGFRIEAGEIEALLRGMDGIEDACVLGVPRVRPTRLAAYVVMSEAHQASAAYKASEVLDAAAIRDALARQLPEYMVPATVTRVAAWPLTTNGKLDVAALPAPELEENAHEPPIGEREEMLAEVWREELELPRVGRGDNFFQRGGHSLLLVRMAARLRERGWLLDLSSVYAARTLAEMAASLRPATAATPADGSTFATGEVDGGIDGRTHGADGLDRALDGAGASAIPPGCEHITPEMVPLAALERGELDRLVSRVPGGAAVIEDIYPLTPLQTGMLVQHTLQDTGDVYLNRAVFAFDEHALMQRFLAAFQRVVDRHPILRTAFHWEALDRPQQVVMRHAVVPVVELQSDQHDETLETLEAASDPHQLRLDLTAAPLLRAWTIHDAASDRWLLALVDHHLISDNYTLQLIADEIRRQLDGQPLSPRVWPYSRQVARALAVDAAAQEQHFRDAIGPMEAPTAPYGLLDVQCRAEDIGQAELTLDAERSARLRQAARRLSVSPAALFHVAFAALVARTSATPDAVIGTVVSGRQGNEPGLSEAMGLFINTLPLRVALHGHTLDQAVTQTAAGLAALMRHEQATLETVRRATGLEASLPLFTALLNYRHANLLGPRGADTQADLWPGVHLLRSEERTNFPLAVSVDDDGQGFLLTVQALHAIDPARVTAHLDCALTHLLEGMETADAGAGTPALLPVLTQAQRAACLAATDRAPAPADWDESATAVHQLFERQARLRPNATALRFEGTSVDYADLNVRADRVAALLHRHGASTDEPIAVCATRGVAQIVALLAVLKSGAPYLPMDPAYPAERLRLLLDDARPRLIVTDAAGDEALAGLLPNEPVGGLEHLSLRTLADLTPAGQRDPSSAAAASNLDARANANSNARVDDRISTDAEATVDREPPLRAVQARDLAYVIYTSGSTGRPKGVMVSHGALLNHLRWQIREFAIDAHDAVLQRTPMSFDASVWELWTPLATGARLVLVPERSVREPAQLTALIRSESVSIAQFVPSLLEALLPPAGDPPPFQCRLLFCGGEALSPALATRARALATDALVNLYGPTETCIDATFWRCADDASGSVPIGRPIDHTVLAVLDAAGDPVPPGAEGELHIGGAGLARGYLHRPDLTAERFIEIGQPPVRFYRTGDRVRERADGALLFLGRNDRQVKVNGIRLELGEVEDQLRALPGVRQAAAECIAQPDGPSVLVGYLCLDPDDAPEAGDDMQQTGDTAEEHLREILASRLPAALVPAHLLVLDQLPLLPNGKLDRARLPRPARAQARPEAEQATPRSPLEQAIAETWAELLGLAAVSRDDHFFRLGGQSLQAIRVVARLAARGIPCSVAQLYAHPTPAALARVLDDALDSAPAAERPEAPGMDGNGGLPDAAVARLVASLPGGQDNVQEILPLTGLQEGLLYHHLADQQGDAYLLQTVLAFDGPERLEAYLGALRRVIARHDALRTSVHWEHLPHPVQVVHRQVDLVVEPVTDLQAGDAADQLRARFHPAHCRLDITASPLVRIWTAFDPERGRWLALLLAHHLVLDHSTLAIVMDEVGAILAGREAELPPSLPYRDLVAAARDAAADSVERARTFDELLGEVTEPTLPLGLPAEVDDIGDLRVATAPLDAALDTRLRGAAIDAGVSAGTLFHLAWARVLATLADRDDVVFGTVLIGRTRSTLADATAVGLMVNTLPLHVQLSGRSVREALSQVQARLTGLLAHDLTPLAEARRHSRVPAQTPLFSALFNYRHSADNGIRDREMAGIAALSSDEFSNYPLNVDIDDHGPRVAGEDGGGWSLTVQVARPHDPAMILALLRTALESLVTAMAQGGAGLVTDLAILPEAMASRIVAQGTGESLPVEPGGLYARIGRQARVRPTATALVDGDRTFSYAELDAMTGRIAANLASLGLGRGDRIALRLPRGWRLPAAMLGILRAGAAYVPLDADLPDERLAFVLQDARPAAVVLADEADGSPVTGPLATLNRLSIDRLLDEPAAAAAALPDDASLARELAYVVYTSGSTGMPRGVEVEHLGMQHRVEGWIRRFGFDEQPPRVLQMARMSVDICLGDLLKALSTGGTVVLCPEEHLLDAALLFELLDRSQASFGDFVPAVLRELTRHARSTGQTLRHLRQVMVGSEAWYGADLDALRAVLPPSARCYNVYGQTESVVDVSICDVTALAVERAEVVPIGDPLANTQLLVLDRRGAVLPWGVTGELHIGGPGLARGYCNLPEQTAARFLEAAPGARPGRLYRTGDLARLMPDGGMDFLGRADSQVKIRGFRVELQEVEAALLALPQVRCAAVVAHERAPGDRQLVAHVELLPAAAARDDATPRAIRQALRDRLPEHMVPTVVMLSPQLPQLASGKVDRRSLPPPEQDTRDDGGPPATPTEAQVSALWRELLRLDFEPQRNADFFDIGGHSLVAARFVTQCRERLGLAPAIRDVFTQRTVAQIAAVIDLARTLAPAAGEPAAGSGPRVGPDGRDDDGPAHDEALTVTEW
ncbi:non-ribosomal peptide synthetase [Mitsuaria sp. GD03876]|uniref:non-ribosomal peptide synthetase n=1 Tax=Mitsuaria sp. GD03876 TaxID=2975399 RepID=UPI00244805BB|nr:non-ribosomal peptide synthetase [Mitsuaria sp. GD03876]MDH0865611.1 amino acid adenylation domain-containing protein [Mitsuaria sp. GD03876]